MEKKHSLNLINELEIKIQLLLKKHIELEKLCDAYQNQNEQLKNKISELHLELENIEKEKTIQSLHSITDQQQKNQLKRYLDTLIKNLDDNIKLLK